MRMASWRGVERDCLVEKVSPAVDERVCLSSLEKGSGEIDDLGGSSPQGGRRGRHRTGKRVPSRGQATAKIRVTPPAAAASSPWAATAHSVAPDADDPLSQSPNAHGAPPFVALSLSIPCVARLWLPQVAANLPAFDNRNLSNALNGYQKYGERLKMFQ